ncbi:MAG: DsbA family protein [Gammaproteobacteria bacterium]|nr:DsbA family protein [Gammaproteobacteria bacterium]
MPESQKTQLKISVLSDYICPFCFIGHKRLASLRDNYDLKINWCFVEIHPETPALGYNVSMLDYSQEHWDELMTNLQQLASEESLQLSPQTITTNSRKALLLAEATKSLGPDYFYLLHEKIFDAYFIKGHNIGDEQVLRRLAAECNIPEQTIETAWNDPFANGPEDSTPKALLPYLQYAGVIQARSVPTFIFGKEILNGVVTKETLLEAARRMA